MDGVDFLRLVPVLYEGMSLNAVVSDESAEVTSIIMNDLKSTIKYC